MQIIRLPVLQESNRGLQRISALIQCSEDQELYVIDVIRSRNTHAEKRREVFTEHENVIHNPYLEAHVNQRQEWPD